MAEPGFFDGDQIRELLIELGRRLAARGVAARMFVVGGAAMALAFNNRRVTRDIDAVFEPKAEVYEEARRMADEHGLPPGWLNDGVKGLMPDLAPPEVGVAFASEGISVQVASAEYLFAMKAAAARVDADTDDLLTLADLLDIRSLEEALELVDRYFAPHRLRPKVRYVLEEVLRSRDHTDQHDTGRRIAPYRREDGTWVRGHHKHPSTECNSH
jgi:hypothetical protein